MISHSILPAMIVQRISPHTEARDLDEPIDRHRLYLDHHSAQQPHRLWDLIAASKRDDRLAPGTFA